MKKIINEAGNCRIVQFFSHECCTALRHKLVCCMCAVEICDISSVSCMMTVIYNIMCESVRLGI